MKINVIKPKSLFFATDCSITINEKKYLVDKDLSIDIPESTCHFYVSLFYLRTKKHILNNGDSFTIQIDRIINKSKFLIICLIAIFLILLNYFFDNKFIEMGLQFFTYAFIGFTFLINTVASKYFFTIKIIKDK